MLSAGTGSETSSDRAPAGDLSWPPSELEGLGRCPACDEPRRRPLHEGVRDWTFHTTNDDWALWRCEACDIAYLDPRPTEASIGKAYQAYYTHENQDNAPAFARPPAPQLPAHPPTVLRPKSCRLTAQPVYRLCLFDDAQCDTQITIMPQNTYFFALKQ